MTYNWQQENWPIFQYELDDIQDVQLDFGLKSGQVNGTLVGLKGNDKISMIIDLMVNRSYKNL